mmetsp:Transcript_36917/g.68119  ORF Transcript_36917/g.68119 Transcript_36917/m.68119 type:complete len:167 (-) Transcript_36917:63-563(-)
MTDESSLGPVVELHRPAKQPRTESGSVEAAPVSSGSVGGEEDLEKNAERVKRLTAEANCREELQISAERLKRIAQETLEWHWLQQDAVVPLEEQQALESRRKRVRQALEKKTLERKSLQWKSAVEVRQLQETLRKSIEHYLRLDKHISQIVALGLDPALFDDSDDE